jgi:hypothetical protein
MRTIARIDAAAVNDDIEVVFSRLGGDELPVVC